MDKLTILKNIWRLSLVFGTGNLWTAETISGSGLIQVLVNGD